MSEREYRVHPHVRGMLYKTGDYHHVHSDHIDEDVIVIVYGLGSTMTAGGSWQFPRELAPVNNKAVYAQDSTL
jgi:hypothetical protein